MVSSAIKWVLSSALIVVACGGKGDGDTAGEPGYEGGPCYEGQCFPPFVCLSNLCVDPNGAGSGPMNSTTTGSSDPGTGTGAMPTSAGPGTPEPTSVDPGTSEPTTGASMTSGPVTTMTTGEATTGGPTTNDATTDDSTTTGQTTQTTQTTGEGGDYGYCGWDPQNSYYSCVNLGGVPGMADPTNQHPIDCPAQLPMDSDACNENGPGITYQGCCTKDGILYFCSASSITVQDCS
ncbi:hypothetical protein [Nannocystis radixulma]|uniref:Uncharacterized protein n=1 Tax=Nannocystis radixulma TaxID=2995305 RepID=A0ABT5BSW4_9BACT|nr:hypothetical protein [Nannocystis radixulma]MDC0676011.1 hypothetical protein [Nannocystis radixulma]